MEPEVLVYSSTMRTVNLTANGFPRSIFANLLINVFTDFGSANTVVAESEKLLPDHHWKSGIFSETGIFHFLAIDKTLNPQGYDRSELPSCPAESE